MDFCKAKRYIYIENKSIFLDMFPGFFASHIFFYKENQQIDIFLIEFNWSNLKFKHFHISIEAEDC